MGRKEKVWKRSTPDVRVHSGKQDSNAENCECPLTWNVSLSENGIPLGIVLSVKGMVP